MPSAGTSTAVASRVLASTATVRDTVRDSEDSNSDEEDNEEESLRKQTALIKEFEAMYKRRRESSEWRWKTLPDPSPRPPSRSPLAQALALACRNALANNAQRPPPLVVPARPIRAPAAAISESPTPAPTPAPAVARVVPPQTRTAPQRPAPTPATHPLNVAATTPSSLHSPGAAAPSPQIGPISPSTATHHSTAVVADPTTSPQMPKLRAEKRRRQRSRSPSPNNSRSCSPDLAAEISRRGLFPMDRRKMVSLQQTPVSLLVLFLVSRIYTYHLPMKTCHLALLDSTVFMQGIFQAVKPGSGILRSVARAVDNSEYGRWSIKIAIAHKKIYVSWTELHFQKTPRTFAATCARNGSRKRGTSLFLSRSSFEYDFVLKPHA